MKYILYSIFLLLSFCSANNFYNQPPLIVEFDVFKEAQTQCSGSDYTKLPCLVGILKNYSNRIYTKKSGQNGKINVIFYAIDNNANIVFPKNIAYKYCEFRDTIGGRYTSKLSGNGFQYILNYNFAYSSSFTKAYISCYFQQSDGKIITQTTQPITVIPNDFDISLSIKDNQDSMYALNYENISTPNVSKVQAPDYGPNIDLTLKTQSYPLNINANATARTINGNIDVGFSSSIIPLSIKFTRDNGLCSPVNESINGNFNFKNGRYINNNININFLDSASGELEIVLGHNLDSDDRALGKCLIQKPESYDISNVGKILCQKPIIIKKRVDILPYSFFVKLKNTGKQIYYNQHTFIPAISNLPTINIDIQALNDRNQTLMNFTKGCYAKDMTMSLDDGKNDFVFINNNLVDSKISKDSFLETSKVVIDRKLSSSGLVARGLTPADAFNSSIVDLTKVKIKLGFDNGDIKYPIYSVYPRVSNDWRIALMRGRISLLQNTNENSSLIANPKVYYEIYCKSPICKIVDIESVISPYIRLPKSPVSDNWYINTAHPANIKVSEENLAMDDNISVYSIGNVSNGIQTIALQSKEKGLFKLKINQGENQNDFATFLYFSPTYINIRDSLGVDSNMVFN